MEIITFMCVAFIAASDYYVHDPLQNQHLHLPMDEYTKKNITFFSTPNIFIL
jgi:hypothetical protein